MRFLFFGLTGAFKASLGILSEMANHTVEIAGQIGDAEQLLRFDTFDAAVMVDDDSNAAIGLARALRIAKCTVPILLLKQSLDADTVSRWLETVDDVIRMPVDAREVLARATAVVRRASGHASAVLEVDNVSVDLSNSVAKVNGGAVHLTQKEFQLLCCLMLRRGVTTDKAHILSSLYVGGEDEPEMKIVDVFLCKLRKKLITAGAAADFIGTVWGRGYIVGNRNGSVPIHPGRPAAPTGLVARIETGVAS